MQRLGRGRVSRAWAAAICGLGLALLSGSPGAAIVSGSSGGGSDCVLHQSVSTTADNGPGSLRQAVLDACDGGDIFIDATGTMTLTSGPIEPLVTLRIAGPGAKNL